MTSLRFVSDKKTKVRRESAHATPSFSTSCEQFVLYSVAKLQAFYGRLITFDLHRFPKPTSISLSFDNFCEHQWKYFTCHFFEPIPSVQLFVLSGKKQQSRQTKFIDTQFLNVHISNRNKKGDIEVALLEKSFPLWQKSKTTFRIDSWTVFVDSFIQMKYFSLAFDQNFHLDLID